MAAAPNGFLLLDKPAGWSSHRVVSRVRKWLGTRKVGHAGTLDPMATGVLVVGVGPSTRLLTFAVGLGKTYTATIRLGASTPTDDADSAPDRFAQADRLAALDLERIEGALGSLRGDILQRPSAVSAIKVDGRRAYARVRAGEDVELDARPVTVSRFDVVSALRSSTAVAEDGAEHGVVDVDVVVDCSSGTYVRALARDLGDALGAFGHLTALRRTRVGDFPIDEALTVPDFDAHAPVPELITPAAAAAALLPTIEVSAEQAVQLRQGRFLAQSAFSAPAAPEPYAAISGAERGEHGELVAVLDRRDDSFKSRVVFPA
ncbi:MAG: tRNA pseudouridine(55) synthase TruB [Brevibacterium yomogidense]|uniref:tRNA pseudouridine(55) synthase TruB n=1 Tax=Brevibacterium sp. Mu109 TaxID=1255669 RepID=UPI000C6955CC|nr:tRNA pseudouridine(55) synthase TruB [Brevibacterium sp. Mu109]SMX69939.1 tRNA pseudouridine55 synthase [Brevibacterium sp. Mu109]